MVVELADEVVAAFDRGPAEERVGLDLHGAFTFDDPASLVVGRNSVPAQVGRVAGRSLLFDLDEQGVFAAVALHVDAVVAQADGAGAHDLEGYIDRTVLREEVAPFDSYTRGSSGG